MKVLMAHNYFQHRGGEDVCFEEETQLLRDRGHDVIQFSQDNHRVSDYGKLELARKTLWNPDTFSRVRELIRKEGADILHCHNYFPLLSPSVYDAAHAEGVPVVQHLHDYRFGCIKGWFYRNDRVCDDCLKHSSLWPGLVHRCYRESFPASLVSTLMLLYHRRRGTWRNRVDRFIALTENGRARFGQCGLPLEKITVRPNFLSRDPGMVEGPREDALFVGRLSSEKGISTLLEAWRSLRGRLKLKIVGDGPLAGEVRRFCSENSSVEWLGFQKSEVVLQLLRSARFMVFPSVWYECLPRVIVESFAVGTPVISSDLGAMTELVDHAHTGRRFAVGDAQALVAEVNWCLSHPEDLVRYGGNARRQFEEKYSTESNYLQLIQIYEQTIDSYKRRK